MFWVLHQHIKQTPKNKRALIRCQHTEGARGYNCNKRSLSSAYNELYVIGLLGSFIRVIKVIRVNLQEK